MKNTIKYTCFLLMIGIMLSITGQLTAQIETTYTWSYELEGQAWNDWDSINSVWMKEIYSPCLKANKLKMSCAHCTSIYIDAGMTIDGQGKLIGFQIFKENICFEKASEKLKDCFFGYYKRLVFPKSLHNKKIRSKFGTGLKC